MKCNVNKQDFMDRFQMFEGRYDGMGGYGGLSALYEYLINLEEDTGIEIELDVIALCCDFTQYDSFEDITTNYEKIETLNDLKDNTMVIEYQEEGKDKYIIQNF